MSDCILPHSGGSGFSEYEGLENLGLELVSSTSISSGSTEVSWQCDSTGWSYSASRLSPALKLTISASVPGILVFANGKVHTTVVKGKSSSSADWSESTYVAGAYFVSQYHNGISSGQSRSGGVSQTANFAGRGGASQYTNLAPWIYTFISMYETKYWICFTSWNSWNLTSGFGAHIRWYITGTMLEYKFVER